MKKPIIAKKQTTPQNEKETKENTKVYLRNTKWNEIK